MSPASSLARSRSTRLEHTPSFILKNPIDFSQAAHQNGPSNHLSNSKNPARFHPSPPRPKNVFGIKWLARSNSYQTEINATTKSTDNEHADDSLILPPQNT